ncbi:MAG: hypothetical protein KAH86_03275 [Methanosarcinales archaeon]|nr:hypothetical protein [Methanosarcinales archaeon]
MEDDAVDIVVHLMALAARTAPKSRGEDDIVTNHITGREKDELASMMFELGDAKDMDFFKRDSISVKQAHSVFLIGVRNTKPVGLNCGACGFKTCAGMIGEIDDENDFAGPSCVFKTLDMGIAIGSAVKTAAMHNVDNRIMYTAGLAARTLGYIDCGVVMGIALSASGKNMFFDR